MKYSTHGVYALDEFLQLKIIKPQRTESAVYIINSQNSNEPGDHWILLYSNKNNQLTFVDSYGKDLQYYGIQDKVYGMGIDLEMIDKHQIQFTYSAVCGGYCILSAYLLCRNKRLKDIVQLFESNNQKYNDNLIRKFIHAHFPNYERSPEEDSAYIFKQTLRSFVDYTN